MKRIFTMLMVVLALSLAACGDGAGNGGGGGSILKAMGPGCITYVFDSDSIARSARGVEVNGEYKLEIVSPKKGDSGFDTDIFIVEITNIEPTGGNKTLTLVPVEQKYREKYGDLEGGAFKVTLNEKNEMAQINGIKGSPPGILTPIGENGKTMKGAWMMGPFHPDEDSTDIWCYNSVIATDNQWTVKMSVYDEHGNIIPDAEDSTRSKYTMSGNKLMCTDWERFNSTLDSWGPCYATGEGGKLLDGSDGEEPVLEEPPYENDILAVSANEISILMHYTEPINDGDQGNPGYVPQYEQEVTLIRVPTN